MSPLTIENGSLRLGLCLSSSWPTLLTAALMIQCCVRRLSSVTLGLCIVAKRCVLEQKLLLTACRKSYIWNWLVPKLMTSTFV